MSQTIIHISGGKVINREALKQSLCLNDGAYLVTIRGYKKRSLPQNKYYWACMVPLVKEGLRTNGYNEVKTDDDAHEVIKHLFLRKDIARQDDGEVLATIGASTTELSTIEFNEYIDNVIQWAAEFLNVQIPYPNEPLVMFKE